jgi:hypothetical protein
LLSISKSDDEMGRLPASTGTSFWTSFMIECKNNQCNIKQCWEFSHFAITSGKKGSQFLGYCSGFSKHNLWWAYIYHIM